MADVFVEQLVSQKTLPKNKLIKLGIWLLAIFLFIVFTMLSLYIGQIGGIIAVSSLVGAWYLSAMFSVEYEYIYLNGEIDFDKIMGKRTRKRIFTIRVTSFNDFGQYSQTMEQTQFDIKYNFAQNLCETDYYITFVNKDNKNCILFFSPNEKLANELTKLYKQKIKFGR